MIARTHDLAAFTALSVIALSIPSGTISLATVIIAVVANLLGGIAPDVDQPTAPLWRNLPIGKYLGKLFDKMSGGHRWLTHSLLGVVLFAWLVHLLLVFLKPIMGSVDITVVWVAFIIGMSSHLLMDSFTKEGIPLLLPIPVRFGIPPIKSLRITTGKFIETWLIFPGLVVFNLWFYFNHYEQILAIIHTAVR